MNRVFERSVELPADAESVLCWHGRPGALERLTPPWETVEVESREGDLRSGRVHLRARVGPLRPRWVAQHVDAGERLAFRDVQVEGPFAHWDHTHRLHPAGDRCVLEDHVEYRLPGWWLGRLVAGRAVERRLERLFAYRHRVLREDLARHRSASANGTEETSAMRVAITGSSGLVGSSLTSFLKSGGHGVVRFRRGTASGSDTRAWDPARGVIAPQSFEGVDAVVHLAGENIAARWTAARKERIRSSRVDGTRLVAGALAEMERPPSTLVCASAVGLYGSRGVEELDEASAKGAGFLADVCEAWEGAARPAAEAGLRVVHLRFGVILSTAGGALPMMLPPFRLGLGGRVGSGDQYMPWVALDDAVGAIHHALTNDSVRGPVNVVAPETVTNAEYTRTLGRVLGRPTVFPLPAFAARLVFGEMADELLLASQRARPRVLEETGYRFSYPQLEGALRHVLGREA